MPFVSQAQQRWGNSASGVKALGGKPNVAEWNSVTPKSLPEKVKKRAPFGRALLGEGKSGKA